MREDWGPGYPGLSPLLRGPRKISALALEAFNSPICLWRACNGALNRQGVLGRASCRGAFMCESSEP